MADYGKADHYSVKSGVTLGLAARAFVGKVADAFFDATGKEIVVTDAYREPADQAAAMYTKFLGPEWNIYKDKQALAEIRSVYLRDVAARKSREETIADMTTVIEAQVEQQRYISRHLVAGALDFRRIGLSPAEVLALEKAARDSGAKVVINEGSPPHLHVQF